VVPFAYESRYGRFADVKLPETNKVDSSLDYRIVHAGGCVDGRGSFAVGRQRVHAEEWKRTRAAKGVIVNSEAMAREAQWLFDLARPTGRLRYPERHRHEPVAVRQQETRPPQDPQP
jgi:hypothetical protein